MPLANPGPKGNAGDPGRTVHHITTGVPSAALGVLGDFALNPDAAMLFGPKAVDGWPEGVSLKGPAGDDGEPGRTIIAVSDSPASGQGEIGDFALNGTTGTLWGPKQSESGWPSPRSIIGPKGDDGAQGLRGVQGDPGAAGVDGSEILSVTGAPTAGLGKDGDWAIDTTNKNIYGPKIANSWPQPKSLSGNTLLNGTTAPSNSLGQPGDFYIRTTTDQIYGPKGATTWPSPKYLVGPTGPAGPPGVLVLDAATAVPAGTPVGTVILRRP